MNEVKITRTGEDYALQALMSGEVKKRLRREIRSSVFWGALSAMVLMGVVVGATIFGLEVYREKRILAAQRQAIDDKTRRDLVNDLIELCVDRHLELPSDIDTLTYDQVKARYGKQAEHYQRRKEALRQLSWYEDVTGIKLGKIDENAPIEFLEGALQELRRRASPTRGTIRTDAEVAAAKKNGG